MNTFEKFISNLPPESPPICRQLAAKFFEQIPKEELPDNWTIRDELEFRRLQIIANQGD